GDHASLGRGRAIHPDPGPKGPKGPEDLGASDVKAEEVALNAISGGAADLDAIPADDHVAGGGIGPADQVAARKLKYNTDSNGEGVGPRRVGANEVALDEVVGAALEEDTGITAQYDIALAGQRAAD